MVGKGWDDENDTRVESANHKIGADMAKGERLPRDQLHACNSLHIRLRSDVVCLYYYNMIPFDPSRPP